MSNSLANASEESLDYFEKLIGLPIEQPSFWKHTLSRLAFPILALLSREQSLRLGLTPIDDERVIIALSHTNGRVLDVGCGSNFFVKSYKNGVGVDVANWKGSDELVSDAAQLPYKSKSFDTVSYLACLNHISNREDSMKEAYRLLKKDGIVLVTMITPKLGKFVHWLRYRHDPDHKSRGIHEGELLGMSSEQVIKIMKNAGFSNIIRKKFVYGLNSLYIGKKLKTN